MQPRELEELARIADQAAERARKEILPRFRAVAIEHKADGSPVTEADRAAERAIREWLRSQTPDFAILGEEYGDEGTTSKHRWVVDPIDGTIAFSRGLPLFGTLIALLEDDVPVLGLIDLPALGERTLGWRDGGCWRNGARVQVSGESDPRRALVSHGDLFCFDRAGQRAALEQLVRTVPMLRGYTDAFGHAQVLAGAIDAMVDLDLNPWDAAATQALTPEAGGKCLSFPQPNGKLGLVFGNPGLVDALAAFLTPVR